jgi:hypothetical protein
MISGNPNITIADILSVDQQKWNWDALSYWADVTLEDVMAHPELPWEWENLCENRNVTMHDILNMVAGKVGPFCDVCDCSDCNLAPQHWMNWRGLSAHASITVDDVAAHLDLPWDFSGLSDNPFAYDTGDSTGGFAPQRRQAKRTAAYKKELMERAWHPDRFLTWCVETEERGREF